MQKYVTIYVKNLVISVICSYRTDSMDEPVKNEVSTKGTYDSLGIHLSSPQGDVKYAETERK
jgi:putative lipoic acid-binding regulatory protein